MSYVSMRKPEMDYFDNLQCWTCFKDFSSRWHLLKHLEAGKCTHPLEKREVKTATSTITQKYKRPKGKIYTCHRCGQKVTSSQSYQHDVLGNCQYSI